MNTFIKVNYDGIIENAIIIPPEITASSEFINEELGLDGAWVKQVDSQKQFVGSSYIDLELNAMPEKPQDVDWLVYNEELDEWVPNVPFPEDADFVLGYGPQPELVVVEEFVSENGEVFQRSELDIPDGSIVYVWNHQKLEWMLKPEIPEDVKMPTAKGFAEALLRGDNPFRLPSSN